MNQPPLHKDFVGKDITPKAIAGDATELLKTLADQSVNLVVSSPPYNIGKIYEREQKLTFDQYIEWQHRIVRDLARVVTEDGSVCWQVGNHVKDGILTPLDIHFYHLFTQEGFILRNRIIWRFNFGQNLDRRFSGRYETLLWFTRGDSYKFNLDPVRIPQLYPGKRHPQRKAAVAGHLSGNPKGKNPSDYWEFSAERDFIENPVWEIPNVKAGHPEKTSHPCQFPIELAERCVLAMTDARDFVLDPFLGAGSTLIAAAKHNRAGIGFEKEQRFAEIANTRIQAAARGELPMRPSGLPVRRPTKTEKVARYPDEWRLAEIKAEGLIESDEIIDKE
ncbi:DNA-methyltransferase [Rhizobium leguminosarum]|uniref:DNA-methyltransferase n=1 Tax=Rhizobium leguminosarum TaxID=384 RepID=UPI0010316538|nr:site-specific DNA-methyltransferase [Rhizobium leguminosarum]TAU81953.1 site-specific DNA-methyltransferase [Rhizobium leguminosarum]